MRAATEVDVGLDARGRSVVRQMRCEAPLLVRVVDSESDVLRLVFVNGAAGPLGGDELRVRLSVEPRARVEVRSVAASLAQPGAAGVPSTFDIDIEVGDDATLDWSPQPTVSVSGSDHRTTVHLIATSTSHVRLHEAVVLGRYGEDSGRIAFRQRVVIDGRPVLDHETELGHSALMSPGAHGTGRHITSLLELGSDLPPPSVHVSSTCIAATMQISPRCSLTLRSA
ncbi:MAG: urease accessory protein UreD [Ilumatobacteraceae bacterium]